MQTVDKGALKIGAMDILWGEEEKLVFVTSYSDDETGIYSYPIPQEFHPSSDPVSRRKRSPDDDRNSMRKIDVSTSIV